jgi:hypothetical protein
LRRKAYILRWRLEMRRSFGNTLRGSLLRLLTFKDSDAFLGIQCVV